MPVMDDWSELSLVGFLVDNPASGLQWLFCLHARMVVILVPPRAEFCVLNLPAHYGLIHKGERKSAAQGGTPVGRGKGRGINPSPAGAASSPPSGGAAGFTLLTHHRPRRQRRQPQFTAICSKHGATCARHVCGRKQAHKRVAKNIY